MANGATVMPPGTEDPTLAPGEGLSSDSAGLGVRAG